MLGIHLRASTEDFDMARLVGVRANVVIVAAFAITGLLAGVVAPSATSSRTGSVSPTMGANPLLVAFVGGGARRPRLALRRGHRRLPARRVADRAAGDAAGRLSSYTRRSPTLGVIAIFLLRPQGLIARRDDEGLMERVEHVAAHASRPGSSCACCCG